MILTVLAFLWQLGFGGSQLGDHVTINATATDTSGNVFITGQFQTVAGSSVNFGGSALSSAGDNDVIIAKYNSSGVHQWSMSFGSTGSDIGYGIGTDSSGNVYVTGIFSGTVNFGGTPLVSAGFADVFVAKYSNAGAHVWSQRFGGTGIEAGNAIAVMPDGTFAITGSFGNLGNGAADFGGGVLSSAGNADLFIAKYTSAGIHMWSHRIGGAGTDAGTSVALDTSGSVAMTGYFNGTVSIGCGATLVSVGFGDGLVVEYTSAGLISWLRQFGGQGDERAAVAVSTAGDVVIAGTFDNCLSNGCGVTVSFGGTAHPDTGSGTDIFIAKYSSTGAWQWDSVFGASFSSDNLKAVAVDGSGNIAVTGQMVNGLDFGGGPLCNTCSTYDVYYAKFSGAGSYIAAQRFVENYDERGFGIAFDASGNFLFVGDYLDQEDFGGGPLPTNGVSNLSGFLTKFGP